MTCSTCQGLGCIEHKSVVGNIPRSCASCFGTGDLPPPIGIPPQLLRFLDTVNYSFVKGVILKEEWQAARAEIMDLIKKARPSYYEDRQQDTSRIVL